MIPTISATQHLIFWKILPIFLSILPFILAFFNFPFQVILIAPVSVYTANLFTVLIISAFELIAIFPFLLFFALFLFLLVLVGFTFLLAAFYIIVIIAFLNCFLVAIVMIFKHFMLTHFIFFQWFHLFQVLALCFMSTVIISI